MRSRKILLALFLALVMVATMAPVTAFAETDLEMDRQATDETIESSLTGDAANVDYSQEGETTNEAADAPQNNEEYATEPQTRDLQPINRQGFSTEEVTGGVDEGNIAELQIDTTGQWSLEASRARLTQRNIPVIADVSGRLTPTNLQSQYSFTISGGTKAMYLQFLSNEHTYTLTLFQFLPSANQYLFTGVQVSPSNTNTSIVNLPNGNYILAVMHNGWVGTDYNIRMNASNPADLSRIYVASNLQTAVHSQGNSLIYMNGVGHSIPSEYRRSSSLSGSWGYDNISTVLDQFEGFVPLGIVTYRVQNHGDSTFITSNSALAIRVGTGTSVFANRSRRVTDNWDNVLEREYHNNCGKGWVTPRRLDWRDVNDRNILIYCLERGEFIDWAGPSNPFARNRPSPTMTIVYDFGQLRSYLS